MRNMSTNYKVSFLKTVVNTKQLLLDIKLRLVLLTIPSPPPINKVVNEVFSVYLVDLSTRNTKLGNRPADFLRGGSAKKSA